MIEFIKKESKMTVRESRYWKKLFNCNLMIGTEIEQMFEDRSIGTREVKTLLSPLGIGGDPSSFKSPVSDVKSDGSLRGGAEIITPGRKIYGFMEQFSMYQSIYNLLKQNEPIIDSRCGWHNHIVLQDYGANAKETKYIPRIIFDNLMQILKRYYPALAFMTSTMPYDDCITRYDFYNLTHYLKTFDSSEKLSEIKRNFSDRYNAINLYHLSTNNQNDALNNFHFEFRFPDGTLFPIQMASLNILFKALVLKSIELSKHGVIKYNEDTDDLYCIKNGGEGGVNNINSFDEEERKSSMINEETMNKIIDLSKELISFLEPELTSIDKIAIPFLNMLANKPISLMFRELKTNDLRIVNDKLEEELDKLISSQDEQIEPLMEIIDLGLVRNTETKDEWINKVSCMVSYKEPVESIINKINNLSELGFSKELGFYFK